MDIIQALIQQADYRAARNYWKVLKNRLGKECSEVVTKCNRLKMAAEDGKMRQKIVELGWLVKDGRPGEPSTIKKVRRAWDIKK